MYKTSLIFATAIITISLSGCGGTSEVSNPSNTIVNAANSNVLQTANTATTNSVTSNSSPANLPPEFSGEVKQLSNVAGIPSQVKSITKGTTPTPGIPSEAELKKPFKPGATPTPGIPDPETIRKALNQRPTNVNVPPPAGSDQPMMKSKKRTGGKIQ